jgi:hypothetical protein
MLAIYSGKVNDCGEIADSPVFSEKPGLKLVELTSWKITFNVANFRSYENQERLVKPGVLLSILRETLKLKERFSG